MITAVILGALILSIGVAVASVSSTGVLLARQADSSFVTRMLATACAEEALFRLKLGGNGSVSASGNYTGTASIPIGSAFCQSIVSAGSTCDDSGRTLIASATSTTDSGSFSKRVSLSARFKCNADGDLNVNDANSAEAFAVLTWQDGDPP